MARRSTSLDSISSELGGTTAAMRQQQGPDPDLVKLDGRSDADLISSVQAYASTVDWQQFSDPSSSAGLSGQESNGLDENAIGRLLASSAASEEFSEAQLRWLGRPHFTLLLVFIRLIRHYRELLNGITSRHLDHYYRQRLGFRPRPAQPDRVTVAFELASQAEAILLPAGSLLSAGNDSEGNERLYSSSTDLYLNHARVRELQALRVVRQATNLESVRATEPEAATALNRMLGLIYGDPGPGDAMPALTITGLSNQTVQSVFLRSLGPLLRFSSNRLKLELQELQDLMRLYKRRTDADSEAEWNAINNKLGINKLAATEKQKLVDTSDFDTNFYAAIAGRTGVRIDWSQDGISELNGIDDLYTYRDMPEVATYLSNLLGQASCLVEGATSAARVANFLAMMPMKKYIDNEWRQANWLLQRSGQRQRNRVSWQLNPSQSGTAAAKFADNFETALLFPDTPASCEELRQAWNTVAAWAPLPQLSPAYPHTVASWLDSILASLQDWFAMPAERLLQLVSLVEVVVPAQPGQAQAASSTQQADAWHGIIEILGGAHLDLQAQRRRAGYAQCRQSCNGGPSSPLAFDQCVQLALKGLDDGDAGAPASTSPSSGQQAAVAEPWTGSRTRLSAWITPEQLQLMDQFQALLCQPGSAPRFSSWADVDDVLGAAAAAIEGWQPPPIGLMEWRQLHGQRQQINPKALAAGTLLEPCFAIPAADPANPPLPGPGLALASRLLGLSEGQRTIILTLGLEESSFNLQALVKTLQPPPGNPLNPDQCAGVVPQLPSIEGWGLNQALLVELSSSKGWLAVPIQQASLTAAIASTDPKSYWNLIRVQPASPAAQPSPPSPAAKLAVLQLRISLDRAAPAVAGLAPGELPRLRIRLRPRFDPVQLQWRSCGGFEPLRLAAAHLRVNVVGLTGLRLQQDGAPLDPLDPFEPFGSNPEIGNCLYISHPELLDGDLEQLNFKANWQDLPGKQAANLQDNYKLYSGWDGLALNEKVNKDSFKVEIGMWSRYLGLVTLPQSAGLFTEPSSLNITSPCQLNPMAQAAIGAKQSSSSDDLRLQDLVWRWRLSPTDFGHNIYPTLTTSKAQELALALSKKATFEAMLSTDESKATPRGAAAVLADYNTKNSSQYKTSAEITSINPADYTVAAPYTPTLNSLEVSYNRSQDLTTSTPAAGQLLHLHPFGETPITLGQAANTSSPQPSSGSGSGSGSGTAAAGAPFLLPNYSNPAELFIGLEGCQPPQPITLAFQLAEGSARGERPAVALYWQVLDGGAWRDVQVHEDGTNGLLHSGILRLALPLLAAGEASRSGSYWLRACLLAPVEAYATILAIQTQAVEAVWVEQREGPLQDRQPLPPHSIKGLVVANGQIASIQQPFSSRGGIPAEAETQLRLGAAERLRHKGRALAGWDYERLLWDGFSNQIQKVKCLAAQDSPVVELLVIPNLRQQVPRNLFSPGAPADLLATMATYLRQRCPPESEIKVRNPIYIHVKVRCWVCLQEGVDRAYAEQQLQQALIKALSPWSHDADADVSIGGQVFVTDIAAAIDPLPFVNYLEKLSLFLVDASGQPLQGVGVNTSVGDAGSEASLQAPGADTVLISYSQHDIEFISPHASPLVSSTGIGILKIGLDFQLT